MWGVEGLFERQKNEINLNQEEARAMVIARAKDIATTQKALGQLTTQDKADLKSSDSRRKLEAERKISLIKEHLIGTNDYIITSPDLAQARNDIWREHQGRIEGRDRGQFISWVGDDQILTQLS